MRFERWPRPESYEVTSRKRAAFARKQRLEREALPLFFAAIAKRPVTVDEEMVQRLPPPARVRSRCSGRPDEPVWSAIHPPSLLNP